MNRWPLALGPLTAIVIGVVVALAVAGVFDGGSGDSPGDGEQADTAALCIEVQGSRDLGVPVSRLVMLRIALTGSTQRLTNFAQAFRLVSCREG